LQQEPTQLLLLFSRETRFYFYYIKAATWAS
jgi:hypothetical protein